MAKYLSNKFKSLKIGIDGFSENLTSLKIVGNVGVGATLSLNSVTGIVNAVSFKKHGGASSEFLMADGSTNNSTFLTAESDTLDSILTRGNTTTKNLTVGDITADNISVGGTITYDDVTSVDSLGIVTARSGIYVGPINAGVATITADGNASFSGLVGIGTTNPQMHELHVNGDAFVDGDLFLKDKSDSEVKLNGQNGSLDIHADGYVRLIESDHDKEMIRFDINTTHNDGRISFEGDHDTFLNHPGDNQLGLTAGGFQIIGITSDAMSIGNTVPNMKVSIGTALTLLGAGNVGIGTDDPKKALHVLNGEGSGFNGSFNERTSAIIEGDANNGTVLSIMSKSSGYAGLFFGDESSEASGQIQYIHSSNSFRFVTSGGTDALILDNGRVGIGTTNLQGDLQIGTSVTVHGNSGIVSATQFEGSFVGDGSGLSGAGVGTDGSINTIGIITATSFSGSGVSLTNLPAGQLIGTVADARISALTASKLTGDLPAISGANLTDVITTSGGNVGDLSVSGIASVGIGTTGDTFTGKVDLFHEGEIKLRTTPAGVQVVGILSATSLDFTGAEGAFSDDLLLQGGSANALWDRSESYLQFNDGAKAVFGTDVSSGDLEIYHSGSHSYINEDGEGQLLITTGIGTTAAMVSDGSITLYYQGTERLKTTSTGITLSGTLSADIDGNAATADKATDLAINATQQLVLQTGNNATDVLTSGTAGYVLQSNGSGLAPSWSATAPANAITGITIREDGLIVGSANSISTINFTGAGVGVTFTNPVAGIATVTIAGGGGDSSAVMLSMIFG